MVGASRRSVTYWLAATGWPRADGQPPLQALALKSNRGRLLAEVEHDLLTLELVGQTHPTVCQVVNGHPRYHLPKMGGCHILSRIFEAQS